MLELRPYQNDIIDAVRGHMRAGIKSILIQSPTGSGKTALTASMFGTAASKGKRAYFIVHRRELIKQSVKAFNKAGIRHGILAAGFLENKGMPVQIASVQTLARRLAWMKQPDLICWDESHHLGAISWGKIYANYPESYHIGLTATPVRTDGTGLSKYFKVMVNGPSVQWLIKNKYLSPYRLYAPPGINLDGVHSRMGDYAKDELEKAVDKPSITGDAIAEYKRLCPGKRAVVFCVSIEHSKHVVAQFKAAGIQAAHVDGETDHEERDKAIVAFEKNEIQVLSNVDLFGEGFDLPALETAILLRPTQSLGLHLQQMGRALRTYEGKNFALILDHAGNTERHGLPDEEREWSLEGRKHAKKANGENVSTRRCPVCFHSMMPGAKVCDGIRPDTGLVCGYVFEVEGRKVDEKEGELSEVDLEAQRAKRDKFRAQGRRRTFEELVAGARAEGRKGDIEGWARHVIRAREEKEAALADQHRAMELMI